MKILQVNNFHYLRGGSERYYFDVSGLLRREGHKVTQFSTQHPQNLPSDQREYFVSDIDFEKLVKNITISNGLKVLSRDIYSRETRKKLDLLLEREKPDLVHVHNFHHHLSPSVLYSIKKFNLPVVMTVHDYESICPNATFLNNRGICEDCQGGRYYRAVLNRCKKDSLPASVMSALTAYIHRILGIYRFIDYFITPSEFLRKKLIEYGFDAKKIVHIPNFLDAVNLTPDYKHQDYFLYLGRLSREKGLMILLKALRSLKADVKLKIVGEGPMEETILEYINTNNLKGRVELLGYRRGKELKNIIKKAMFLALPSECYENFPYVVLEAFAYGKPVIGADIGGVPEQIDDGVNGCLFESGNASALAGKILHLVENPDKVRKMGRSARKKVKQQYGSGKHYESLINLYRKMISGSL
ncbi:MAG: glycosyltransferase family 4 protein [bacterium]